MPTPVQWHFGSFRLDPAHACVWHGEDVRLLSPKVLAVLQYLVRHPDRLVTKDELLDAVWPATAVSDAVVRIAIGTLRKILGDPAHTPRYIATVPRHGYRFLASVTVTPVALAALPASVSPSAAPTVLVEREAMLQHLQQALGAAEQGRRQVVVLSGEPGVGKTALVEMFLTQVAGTAAWVAVGQCVESYGTDEAYLPVLEALGQLCRGPDRAQLVGLLEQYAPTWLLQLPWLLRPSRRAQLHAELQGTTRERMLREGADVLDILTAEQPLVLVLEDLHWSDAATLDLLRLVARRWTPARLLLLGTVRPGEMPMASPPRQRLLADLQRSRAVTLMPVPLLSVDAVAAYLVRRFPQQCVPGTLAAWLHQRTDGHPFFLVTLVQALLEQGVLYEHQGRVPLACG